MLETNLGNATALIKSETAPTKTYVLWAHVTDPMAPDIVIIKRYNGTDWVAINLFEDGLVLKDSSNDHYYKFTCTLGVLSTAGVDLGTTPP